MKLGNWFITLGVIVSAWGCSPSENIVYEEFESVDPSGWDWKESKSFTFEIEDDQHLYNLINGLRITTDYAYSNIWMIYIIKGPNGFYKKEQFQVTLSDNIGKWKGKGISNLISFQSPIMTNVNFKKGKYTIQFFQNMRDQELKDVNNVGLQIIRGQLIL